jgi:hypothetical protein
MKTFSQSATTTEHPTFVSKDALGVVTCRNPKGIYPETFKIAPIWFFEPERSTFKQKKVF